MQVAVPHRTGNSSMGYHSMKRRWEKADRVGFGDAIACREAQHRTVLTYSLCCVTLG
jgi:hypothetical protein